MGGKSKKSKKPSVQHAPMLDYNALMQSANEQAAASARAQVQAQIEAYPEMERLQLGTLQRIADNLNNQYTRDAMAGVDRTVGDAATIRNIGGDMRGTAAEIQGIGRLLQSRADETSIERQLRQQAEAELGIGRTLIEQRLLSDAERELSLGRTLSAEEQRDAQQSARAAFAARGLGNSLGSSAAEILNRDSFGRQREAERRQFAMGAEQYATAGQAGRRNFAAATNNMVSGNVFNRFGQAAGLMGNAAQVQQGAANAFSQGATIDANAAQMRANLDPYQRALGNAQIGSQLGANLQSGIGQTFGNAQQMAGNIASFNANMIDSRANTQLNNWAAMNAARMGASAQQSAGMMGMFGGIGGGAVIGAGIAI
jgi:Tfp pilus assembly protein PilV